MADYAALVSLMNIMDQIANHPRHSMSLDKSQIESLGEKLRFLLDFVETDCHGVVSKQVQVLESRIASAAYAAEDAIESHVVNQIYSGLVSSLDLQMVIEDMDSIKKKVMELREQSGSADVQLLYSTPTTSSTRLTTNKNTMVGFDEKMFLLLDRLTRQSNEQIIPIVGMGGIGKTTLARHCYEHALVMKRFDIRAWATISETYNVKEILLQLHSWQSKSHGELDREMEEEIGVKLYKQLWARRYLIILDDIWSIEAWDKIKLFLPNNNNGSRIVITTRISSLSIHFDSPRLELTFLDEDKSWKLFRETTFGQASCPPELEETGKEIAKKCKGLPLSIVVICGLLRRSNMTLEYWKSISKDLMSILSSGEDEDCMNLLCLSYTHLPACLKPCLLYMGIFHEDQEVHVSELIKLWVAEGFIKRNEVESLEETARAYLNDLLERNLILKQRSGSNGKFRTFKIHDLLRDLCLNVAHKDRFISMVKGVPRGINIERRVVFTENILEEEYHSRVFPILRSASLARSLSIITVGVLPFNNRLLRVLNVLDKSNNEEIDLPKDTFDQVNLVYLCFGCYYEKTMVSAELPTSISLLWNMQVLIIYGEIYAPSQIWEMRQLRHLNATTLYIPHPSPTHQENDHSVLRNLQTLKSVIGLTLSEEVCKRIPNVKKLRLRYYDREKSSKDYCLHNLCRLHKLESLTCSSYYLDELLSTITFPSSLKKLALAYCGLRWDDLTIIGSLQNLEVLKLGRGSVKGPEWNPIEGEFLRLKFLMIYKCELVYWNVDCSHFPVLENLVLVGLDKLDEIPLDIGEIPTLENIRVSRCSVSAAISAMNIAKEQEFAENKGLQVLVEFKKKSQVENFCENVVTSQESNNFQVKIKLSTRSVDKK